MGTWKWFVVGLAIGPGVLASSRPASAQVVTVPVALSGTPAPAGGNYSALFDPVLNGSGQVAYSADLTGGSSSRGVFVGAPGAVQTVALQGTPAPAGGNYTTLYAPVLNGSGQLAYRADLTGGSSSHGVFVGAPGAVQTVALQGTPAPAGGIYSSLGSVRLNRFGQVAYRSDLTGGSSTAGVFVGMPGAVQAVALQGTPAPAGGNYGFITHTLLNGSGQVAVRATLTGGSSSQGVFVGTPGAVQAAALQGTPASDGGNYNSFGFVGLNGSGQVAFSATLIGGSSNQGIFVGAPGAVQAAALSGTPAPGGGTYAELGELVVNGSGQVAFQANVIGVSSREGVFVGSPGAVQAAARAGTTAPGGGIFNNFLGGPVVNGLGQVAFNSWLTAAGVNDQGLYAGSVGALVKVAREGDQVDVDPGPGVVLRTIADNGISALTSGLSGGEDGLRVSFSDTGLLTYRLTFTDGSSGIFLSSITVPEPSSAGLVVAGLAAMAWLKRRGSRRHV